MSRLLALFCVLTVSAVAQSNFWQQLTPEERRAAGVEQLTPAQQAALDAAAERFAREGARQAVEVVKAESAEKLRVVREQAKAEAKAEVKAEARQQRIADAGLAVRQDDETIRTQIQGEFRGWTGHSIFTMTNGQTWQQTERENRFIPKKINPDVELIPSKLGGWKLKLVSEGLWIRVKRIH